MGPLGELWLRAEKERETWRDAHVYLEWDGWEEGLLDTVIGDKGWGYGPSADSGDGDEQDEFPPRVGVGGGFRGVGVGGGFHSVAGGAGASPSSGFRGVGVGAVGGGFRGVGSDGGVAGTFKMQTGFVGLSLA